MGDKKVRGMKAVLRQKSNERKDPMRRKTKIHLELCVVAGFGMALILALTRMADRTIQFGLLHSPVVFMVALFFMACVVGAAGFIGYRRCKPYKAEAALKNSFLARHSQWIRSLIAFTATALAVYLFMVCIKSLCVYTMPEIFGAGIMVPGQNATAPNITQPAALLNEPASDNSGTSPTQKDASVSYGLQENPALAHSKSNFMSVVAPKASLFPASQNEELCADTAFAENSAGQPSTRRPHEFTATAIPVDDEANKILFSTEEPPLSPLIELGEEVPEASTASPSPTEGIPEPSPFPTHNPAPTKEASWPSERYPMPTEEEVSLWRAYLEERKVPIPERSPDLSRARQRLRWVFLNYLKQLHDAGGREGVYNELGKDEEFYAEILA